MSDPATILIVDDEPGIREILVEDFECVGYRVRAAAGGHEAFGIIEQESVDLVISDVRMPGGSGIELLQKIQSAHAGRPPVILISGYTDTSERDALAQGAAAMLAKPFNRMALHDEVRRILGR